MRIVSWNMRGQNPDPVKLRNMLNSIHADVLIIQEPYEGLAVSKEETGRASRHAVAPKGPDWTIEYIAASPDSRGQDRYAVAYCSGAGVSVATSTVPCGDKAQFARQYLIVEVEKDGKSLTLASCHAPYQDAKSDEPVVYMQQLFADLEPSKRGDALKSSVDCFMGDTNVYDSSEIKPSGWVAKLSSTTGRGKQGGALDRIFVRGGVTKLECQSGRIGDGKLEGLLSADRRSGSVKDLNVPFDWDRYDHYAVYLDTDPASTPDVEVVANTGGNSRKRGRDSEGEELLQLDGRGRAVSQPPPPTKKAKTEVPGEGQ